MAKFVEKRIRKNKRFGRLKVVERTDEKQHGCYMYKCVCDCKNEILVRSDMLRSGEVQSCGCLHDDLLREHVKKAYKNNFVDGTNIPKISSNKVQGNNTSGVRGVSWHKKTGKWSARISFKGTTYSLGYFDDVQIAAEARKIAEKELFEKYLEEHNKR